MEEGLSLRTSNSVEIMRERRMEEIFCYEREIENLLLEVPGEWLEFLSEYLTNGMKYNKALSRFKQRDVRPILNNGTVQEIIVRQKKIDHLRSIFKKEDLTAFLSAVMNTDISDFIEKIEGKTIVYKDMSKWSAAMRACVSKLSIDKKGHIKIELLNKMAAAEMFAKHFGYYEKDNNQKGSVGKVMFHYPSNGRWDAVEAEEVGDTFELVD